MRENELKRNRAVYTIGHSNHDIEHLVALLKAQCIEVLVDVRSSPYSQYATHFNREPLKHVLKTNGLQYLFLGDAIGGKPDDERYYDNEGYVLYDRIAHTERFGEGIERLLSGMETHRIALMCSEEDPTGCHRRLLIGRVLKERNVDVRHIRGDGNVQTEDEVAAAEEFEKTGGQIYLFEPEEGDAWKSTQSASPKKARGDSSSL